MSVDSNENVVVFAIVHFVENVVFPESVDPLQNLMSLENVGFL